VAVVLSVNVAKPRDIEWQGKTIRTSIWKMPIQGRVRATRLCLVGDGQADLVGHGGVHRAALVYQIESYRFWAELLKRDDFTPGQFGENITVDGLADDEVFIGDRYKIGSAVFEVSQPRVTCFKVGIRLNQPSMPALMVKHRRPGFYFRVIDEGEIGAGDAIEKVAAGPEQMSVAEMDALLYTGNHPLDALERAERISALSPGWQQSIKSLGEAARGGKDHGNAGLSGVTQRPSWIGLRTLNVVSSSMESADIRSFELAAADGSPLPDALPGQYLTVRIQPPGSRAVTRNYSLCGRSRTGRFRIGVKREVDGIVSNYLHDNLRVGGTLETTAPRGDFVLKQNTPRIVLMSAGVGVTPVLAMLHAAASNSDAFTAVWWIHAARDSEHQAFGIEIREAIAACAGSVSRTIYSRPGQNDRAGIDYDFAGRLDLALIQRLELPLDADFFLCGPAAFLEDVTHALQELGVPKARLHLEVFNGQGPPARNGEQRPAPHRPIGVIGTGPSVVFSKSGLSVPWDGRYASLLELAEACDVPLRWSCRSGVCHNCESELLRGSVRYTSEPVDFPPDGIILACCSTPESDLELNL
jgi:ferredoxin-NADP reductase/MOSC domain-containing protein YiiM